MVMGMDAPFFGCNDMKTFRWIKTGIDVWGLQDSPRHFRGFVSRIADGSFSWYITGGPSYSIVFSNNRNIIRVMCGETATRKDAKREVEKIVHAIHRYCVKTSFGIHDYAIFEFENGIPIVRAVGTAKHCNHYLKPGRLIVNVSRYRKQREA